MGTLMSLCAMSSTVNTTSENLTEDDTLNFLKNIESNLIFFLNIENQK